VGAGQAQVDTRWRKTTGRRFLIGPILSVVVTPNGFANAEDATLDDYHSGSDARCAGSFG
jgi:hypothetical protein